MVALTWSRRCLAPCQSPASPVGNLRTRGHAMPEMLRPLELQDGQLNTQVGGVCNLKMYV